MLTIQPLLSNILVNKKETFIRTKNKVHELLLYLNLLQYLFTMKLFCCCQVFIRSLQRRAAFRTCACCFLVYVIFFLILKMESAHALSHTRVWRADVSLVGWWMPRANAPPFRCVYTRCVLILLIFLNYERNIFMWVVLL